LSRLGLQFACAIFSIGLLSANAISQNEEGSKKTDVSHQEVVVTGVQVVHDHGAAVIEIDASRPVIPTIQSGDSPPHLIIDLPNARSGMQRQRIDVLRENILTIRTEESQKTPFVLRIVVNFLVPYGYTWEAAGNRLMVRLKPPEDPYVASRKTAVPPPRVASVTPTPVATFVPVTSGIGEVLLAGRRFAAGSSITAGNETAVLQLSRGGEVRVCPGTSLSVTPSRSANDLMMGLSTGAMETHYPLGASADTVLTPDFRILFSGPGEFDYAISSDSKGNTCVRGLAGNSSWAKVFELIGDRTYLVKPGEQAVFHSGRIDKVDSDVPPECGCPPPVPVMRAEAGSPQLVPDSRSQDVTLSQSNSPASAHETGNTSATGGAPDNASVALAKDREVQALPPTADNEPHVEVEAPLVFRGRANSSAPPSVTSTAMTEQAEALPVIESSRTATLSARVLPPPAMNHPGRRHGVLQHLRGIFAALFR
jgi:hypothetical protein